MNREKLVKLAKKYQTDHGFLPDEDGIEMFIAGAQMMLGLNEDDEVNNKPAPKRRRSITPPSHIPFSARDVNKSGHGDLDIGRIKQYTVIIDKHDVPFYEANGWIENENYPHFGFCDSNMHTTMLGRPLRLSDINTSFFIGKKIVDYSGCYGSYGMGGPGFLGFEFEDYPYVMVCAAWGAECYSMYDGKLLGCHPDYEDKYDHWDIGKFKVCIKNAIVDDIIVNENSFVMKLKKGNTTHNFVFMKNHEKLSPYTGGKKRDDAFEGKVDDHIVLQYKDATLQV